MDLELNGKLAVITGGSKGIGLGIARACARAGADVVITARTPDAIEQASAQIQAKFGVTAIAVASDVSTSEGCQAIVDAAADAAAAGGLGLVGAVDGCLAGLVGLEAAGEALGLCGFAAEFSAGFATNKNKAKIT